MLQFKLIQIILVLLNFLLIKYNGVLSETLIIASVGPQPQELFAVNEYYALGIKKVRFNRAVIICARSGMTLATPKTQFQQGRLEQFLTKYANNVTKDKKWYGWLGATNSDSKSYKDWFWLTDGRKIEYSNWKKHAPLHIAELYLLITIGGQYNYQWDHDTYLARNYALCQTRKATGNFV